MSNLIDFLQEEIPSNAKDLSNSISTTLEIIERNRAALASKVARLFQDGKHDEIEVFKEANKQLMEFENYLKNLGDISDKHEKPTSPKDNTDRNEISTITDKPNYSNCKTDDTVPHNLDEDFTNKHPEYFVLEGKKYFVRNWNRLLILVCEILSSRNPELFQSFPEDESMQGRTRRYFSRTQMKYACKKIGGTNIYVCTNNNPNGNCSIVVKILEKYNIPTTSLEIFLKVDDSFENEDETDENIVKKK